MDEEPSEYIDFIAKYKDWVAVKRIGIRESTKPEEIAFYLAGIKGTIGRKEYALLGINTQVLDAVAEKLTTNMKKDYPSLGIAVSRISDANTKKAIAESCANKDLSKVAASYLLYRVIKNLGFSPTVSQEALSKVFPGLKPPKSPGRKPKA